MENVKDEKVIETIEKHKNDGVITIETLERETGLCEEEIAPSLWRLVGKGNRFFEYDLETKKGITVRIVTKAYKEKEKIKEKENKSEEKSVKFSINVFNVFALLLIVALLAYIIFSVIDMVDAAKVLDDAVRTLNAIKNAGYTVSYELYNQAKFVMIREILNFIIGIIVFLSLIVVNAELSKKHK